MCLCNDKNKGGKKPSSNWQTDIIDLVERHTIFFKLWLSIILLSLVFICYAAHSRFSRTAALFGY